MVTKRFLLNQSDAVINDRWVFPHLILDKKVTNLPKTSDGFLPVLLSCLNSLPYNLFLSCLPLSLISVTRCQGKVPH